MTDCSKGKAGTVHPECIGEKHYSDDHGTGSAIRMSKSPDVDLQKDEGGAMPDTSVQNALEKAGGYETYEEYDQATDPKKSIRANQEARDAEIDVMRGRPSKDIRTGDVRKDLEISNGRAKGQKMQARQQEAHARKVDNAAKNPYSRTGAIASILASKGYDFSADKLERLLNEVLNARAEGKPTRTMKPALAQDIGDAYDAVTESQASLDEDQSKAPIRRKEAMEDPVLREAKYRERETLRDANLGINADKVLSTKPYTSTQLGEREMKSDKDKVGADESLHYDSETQREFGETGRRMEEAKREASGDTVGSAGTHDANYEAKVLTGPDAEDSEYKLSNPPDEVRAKAEEVHDQPQFTAPMEPASEVVQDKTATYRPKPKPKPETKKEESESKTEGGSEKEAEPKQTDEVKKSSGGMPSMAELM